MRAKNDPSTPRWCRHNSHPSELQPRELVQIVGPPLPAWVRGCSSGTSSQSHRPRRTSNTPQISRVRAGIAAGLAAIGKGTRDQD